MSARQSSFGGVPALFGGDDDNIGQVKVPAPAPVPPKSYSICSWF